MEYKIIQSFGPESGERWKQYLNWRRLQLTSFDSVDSILRPDLFTPESAEEWQNCVNADNCLSLITSLEYARKLLGKYENGLIVGVERGIERDFKPDPGLLGYDIIDGYCSVSLLTNWGTDDENLFTSHLSANGLLSELELAISVRDKLRSCFSEDSHANGCTVWGVYDVAVQP